ncbi:MAG: hypothetical protein ACI854_001105 [Arenicella sp.]|jgi:hypothetical protein
MDEHFLLTKNTNRYSRVMVASDRGVTPFNEVLYLLLVDSF